MVCKLWLHHGDMISTAWHLEFLVVPVVCKTADLRERSGTDKRLSVIFLIFRQLYLDVLYFSRTADHLCSIHYRVYYLLIACAAANVLVFMEPVTNFLACRIVVFEKERIRRYDKPGCAESALDRAVIHEGDLYGVQVGRGAYTLYGDDFAVLFNTPYLSGT